MKNLKQIDIKSFHFLAFFVRIFKCYEGYATNIDQTRKLDTNNEE